MSKDDGDDEIVIVPVPPPHIPESWRRRWKQGRRTNQKKPRFKQPPRIRVRDPNRGRALKSVQQYVRLKKMGYTHEQIGELYELGRRNRVRERDD